jgi:hypothetical protein
MSESENEPAIATEQGPRWFAPEALKPIHELNRSLLAILIEEAGKSRATPALVAVGEQLEQVPAQVLARLAELPISLVDADFQADDAWSNLDAGYRTHSGHTSASYLPRPRAFELAALTFGLASATAHASPESARLIFGMTPRVADAFAHFGVEVVQWISQARAHWIRPRWHDKPHFWKRLIATAAQPEGARLPPVGVRAMNRLLADLELATCAADETRRSRR